MKINEKTRVILIFTVIVLLGLLLRYKPYDYKIQHDYPVMIHSADANSRVSEAEWYSQSKQSYYQPAWFDDDKTNILGIEPPLSGDLAALLSQISGIAEYDLLYFVSVLSGIGVAIIFFLLFWKVFNNLGLGALTGILMVYPFEKFYNYQIEIGMYPHFTQLVFLASCILFFIKFLEDNKWSSAIGVSLMFVFTFYSHSPNAIFLLFFISLISIYYIYKKKISLKKSIAIIVISTILIAPYLSILFGNWLTPVKSNEDVNQAKTLDLTQIFTNRAKSHPIQISSFLLPISYLLIIIGIISTAFLIKNDKYKVMFLIFLLFFGLTMVSNYFGVYHGHIQEKPRYILYVFAYPMIAIGIYALSLIMKKTLGVDTKILVLIALSIILILQIFALIKMPKTSYSIITPQTYDAYLYARDTIPDNARILCIGCIQFEGLYTHRPTYIPLYELDQNTINQLVDLAQNNKTEKNINTVSMGHSDLRIYWDGFKLSGYGMKEFTNRSLCEFDYIIFKELGQLTPVIQTIANKMNSMNNSVVYNKNNILIMKNNNLNGECI